MADTLGINIRQYVVEPTIGDTVSILRESGVLTTGADSLLGESSVGTQMTYNTLDFPTNSSVRPLNLPLLVVPPNQPVRYNYSHWDPDEDSIVVRAAPPHIWNCENPAYCFDTNGNAWTQQDAWPYLYKEVPGTTTGELYNYVDNPFDTHHTWKVNDSTQEITFTAFTPGERPLIHLTVDEYRQGQWVGTAHRLWQFQVGMDEQPVPQRSYLPATFVNTTQNSEGTFLACAGQPMAFDFRLGQEVGNNHIVARSFDHTYRTIGSTLSFNNNGSYTVTGHFNWNPYAWLKPGLYFFTVWADDSMCVSSMDRPYYNQVFTFPIYLMEPGCALGADGVQANNGGWSLAPNPAGDVAVLRGPNNAAGASWQAFDAMGRPVAGGKTSAGQSEIHTHYWPVGIYLVRISRAGLPDATLRLTIVR